MEKKRFLLRYFWVPAVACPCGGRDGISFGLGPRYLLPAGACPCTGRGGDDD